MNRSLKIRFFSLLLLLSGAALLQSCYYDIAEELYPQSAACDTSGVKYSSVIEPMVRRSCYSCHGTGINLGDITLEGYDNLKTYANNGRLMGSIEHRSGYSPMPQGNSKLADCDIRKIQAWINAGNP